jgi:hypothetical protein
MTGNDELTKMWKEAFLKCACYPLICMEGMNETTMNLSQDSGLSGQEPKLGSSDCQAKVSHMITLKNRIMKSEKRKWGGG